MDKQCYNTSETKQILFKVSILLGISQQDQNSEIEIHFQDGTKQVKIMQKKENKPNLYQIDYDLNVEQYVEYKYVIKRNGNQNEIFSSDLITKDLKDLKRFSSNGDIEIYDVPTFKKGFWMKSQDPQYQLYEYDKIKALNIFYQLKNCKEAINCIQKRLSIEQINNYLLNENLIQYLEIIFAYYKESSERKLIELSESILNSFFDQIKKYVPQGVSFANQIIQVFSQLGLKDKISLLKSFQNVQEQYRSVHQITELHIINFLNLNSVIKCPYSLEEIKTLIENQQQLLGNDKLFQQSISQVINKALEFLSQLIAGKDVIKAIFDYQIIINNDIHLQKIFSNQLINNLKRSQILIEIEQLRQIRYILNLEKEQIEQIINYQLSKSNELVTSILIFQEFIQDSKTLQSSILNILKNETKRYCDQILEKRNEIIKILNLDSKQKKQLFKIIFAQSEFIKKEFIDLCQEYKIDLSILSNLSLIGMIKGFTVEEKIKELTDILLKTPFSNSLQIFQCILENQFKSYKPILLQSIHHLYKIKDCLKESFDRILEEKRKKITNIEYLKMYAIEEQSIIKQEYTQQIEEMFKQILTKNLQLKQIIEKPEDIDFKTLTEENQQILRDFISSLIEKSDMKQKLIDYQKIYKKTSPLSIELIQIYEDLLYSILKKTRKQKDNTNRKLIFLTLSLTTQISSMRDSGIYEKIKKWIVQIHSQINNLNKENVEFLKHVQHYQAIIQVFNNYLIPEFIVRIDDMFKHFQKFEKYFQFTKEFERVLLIENQIPLLTSGYNLIKVFLIDQHNIEYANLIERVRRIDFTEKILQSFSKNLRISIKTLISALLHNIRDINNIIFEQQLKELEDIERQMQKHSILESVVPKNLLFFQDNNSKFSRIKIFYKYDGNQIFQHIIKYLEEFDKGQSIQKHQIKERLATLFLEETNLIIKSTFEYLMFDKPIEDQQQIQDLPFVNDDLYVLIMEKRELKNPQLIDQIFELSQIANFQNNLQHFNDSKVIISNIKGKKDQFINLRYANVSKEQSLYLTKILEFYELFLSITEEHTKYFEANTKRDGQGISMYEQLKSINEKINNKLKNYKAQQNYTLQDKYLEWKDVIDNFTKIVDILDDPTHTKQYYTQYTNIVINGDVNFWLENNVVQINIQYDKDNYYSQRTVYDCFHFLNSDKEVYQQYFSQKQNKNIQKSNVLMKNFPYYYGIFQILLDKIGLLQKIYNFGLLDFNKLLKQNCQKFYQADKKEIQNLSELLRRQKNAIKQAIINYPVFSNIGYRFYKDIHSLIINKFPKKDHQIVEYIEQLSGINLYERANMIDSNKNLDLIDIGGYVLTPRVNLLKLKFLLMNIFKQSDEIRINILKYSCIEQAIYYLIRQTNLEIIDNENLKSQYYLFQDSTTEIQDIDLFIHRYNYYFIKEPMNFFLILNNKPNDSIWNLLQELTKQNKSRNNLYIYIQEQLYQESLSQVNIIHIDQVKEDKTQLLKQNLSLLPKFQNITFIHSKQPGTGKSFWISDQCKQKELNTIRISTNGNSDKESIIKYLQQQNNRETNYACHFDLYENDSLEINFLLFELIFLNSLNSKSQLLAKLKDNTQLFFEISCSYQERFKSSIVISKYFKEKNISFNVQSFIEDFQINSREFSNQSIPYTAHKYLSILRQLDADPQKQIEIAHDKNTSYNINQYEFNNLVSSYFIEKCQKQCSDLVNFVPNYYQIVNFIKLFGNEMQLIEMSIFSSLNPKQEDQKFVLNKLFELCCKLSISHVPDISENDHSFLFQNGLDFQTKKLENTIQFDSMIQDFVTATGKQSQCLSYFFSVKTKENQSFINLFENQSRESIILENNEKENQNQLLNIQMLRMCNDDNQKFNDVIQNSEQANKNHLEIFQNMVISKQIKFRLFSIILRLRAGIPIILMGEAGIGKSHFVNYLATFFDYEIVKMIIHEGVTENEVIDLIEQQKEKINQSEKKDQKYIIFFDEINTNKQLSGLFKEILTDKHLKGIPIDSNIIPIGAINPYKKKCEQQDRLMKAQILVGKRKEFEEKYQQCKLEYMVQKISESLQCFVWNFDRLDETDERIIIKNMILKNKKISELYNSNKQKVLQVIDLVQESQRLVRQELGYSSCSIRDVKRFCTVLSKIPDFINNCPKTSLEIESSFKDKIGYYWKLFGFNVNKIDYYEFFLSVYLSLYITYYVRIPYYEKRKDYLSIIESKDFFKDCKNISSSKDEIQKFLLREIIISQKKKGIAQNKMLRENVFILFICIIYKIPVCLIGNSNLFIDSILNFIFLKGQPGSSKSLSMKLLEESLKGKQSPSKFFRKYPTLMKKFYQGHIQSKSEDIELVFNETEEQQKSNEELKNNCLYLLYIDEIGLAEISPYNPLKVIHKTLDQLKVAVACISNWPLDASKMNRMLAFYWQNLNMQIQNSIYFYFLVSQSLDYDEIDLQDTIECIVDEVFTQKKPELEKKFEMKNLNIENWEKELKENLKSKYLFKFSKLYKSYMEKINDSQNSRFHGLRDFFNTGKQFCVEQLDNIENDNFNVDVTIKINKRLERAFQRNFSGLISNESLNKAIIENIGISSPSSYQPKEFIKLNLNEKSDIFPSRNLLISTDSINMTIQYLKKIVKENHKIIIGSGFKQDLSEQGIYSVINKIMRCAKYGFTIILYNYESIYQSLYDLVDQNYDQIGDKSISKVYFGKKSYPVEVHKDFKCVLLVEEKKIQQLDSPLLNRFEKHVLLLEKDLLDKKDKYNIEQIYNFIKNQNQPIHKITNLLEICVSYYLQYKEQLLNQSQSLNSVEEEIEITEQDKNNIKGRLFHLFNFNQVAKKEQSLQTFQEEYQNAKYLYSLNDFVEFITKNKGINQNTYKFYQYWQQNRTYSNQKNVKFYQIYTQDSFDLIPDTNKIIISNIPSYENLENCISEFMEGNINNIRKIKSCQNSQIEQNQIKRISSQHDIQPNDNVLLILIDISSDGKDSYDKLENTVQCLNELALSYKQTEKLLQIILIIKVDKEFRMVPISNSWEYYYLDNLFPNSHFDKIIDQQRFSKGLEQLTLQNILTGITMNHQDLIELFIFQDNQLIESAIKLVEYENDQQENLIFYQQKRINQFFTLFQKNEQIIKETIEKIISDLLKKEKVEGNSSSQYIEKYLLNKNYNSMNFYKAFIESYQNLIIQSIKYLYYQIEEQGQIFQLNEAEEIQRDILEQTSTQIANKIKEEQVLPKLRKQADLYFVYSKQLLNIVNNFELDFTTNENEYLQNFENQYYDFIQSMKAQFGDDISFIKLIKENQEQIYQDIFILQPNYSKQELTTIINLIQNSYPQQPDHQFFTWIYLNQTLSKKLSYLFKTLEKYSKYTKLNTDFFFKDLDLKNQISLSNKLTAITIRAIQQQFNTVSPYQLSNKIDISQAKKQKIYNNVLNCISQYAQIIGNSELKPIENTIKYLKELYEEIDFYDEDNNLNYDNIFNLQFLDIINFKKLFQKKKASGKRKIDPSGLLKKWRLFMQTLLWNVVENNNYRKIDVNLLMILLNLEQVDKQISESSRVSLSFKIFVSLILQRIIEKYPMRDINYYFQQQIDSQYRQLRIPDDKLLHYSIECETLFIFSKCVKISFDNCLRILGKHSFSNMNNPISLVALFSVFRIYSRELCEMAKDSNLSNDLPLIKGIKDYIPLQKYILQELIIRKSPFQIIQTLINLKLQIFEVLDITVIRQKYQTINEQNIIQDLIDYIEKQVIQNFNTPINDYMVNTRYLVVQINEEQNQ